MDQFLPIHNSPFRMSFTSNKDSPLAKYESSSAHLDKEFTQTMKFNQKGPKKVKQYILGEILGSGSYGKVYEGIDSINLKRVAVKKLKLQALRKVKGGEEMKKNEISILKLLKQENVLSLIEIFEIKEKKSMYIVLEFCGAGSLQQVIDSHPNKRLPLPDVWK